MPHFAFWIGIDGELLAAEVLELTIALNDTVICLSDETWRVLTCVLCQD